MQKEFTNVTERWMLYDTVAASELTALANVPGWYTTLAALGTARDLPFFNTRSRAIGLPYCNMDQRDAFPYAFHLHSVGVTFFANTWTTVDTTYGKGDASMSPEDQVGHLWCVDIPRHAGGVLRVQQDDRLKATSMMLQPGYGPIGDGYGRSAPTAYAGAGGLNPFDHHLGVVTQGVPHVTVRFPLPAPIQIPRRATLAFDLKLNEYCSQLLQAVPASQVQPMANLVSGAPDNYFHSGKPFYGIQVSLEGFREVQQRGQYHA
jgi:hypothetical protein